MLSPIPTPNLQEFGNFDPCFHPHHFRTHSQNSSQRGILAQSQIMSFLSQNPPLTPTPVKVSSHPLCHVLIHDDLSPLSPLFLHVLLCSRQTGHLADVKYTWMLLPQGPSQVLLYLPGMPPWADSPPQTSAQCPDCPPSLMILSLVHLSHLTFCASGWPKVLLN